MFEMEWDFDVLYTSGRQMGEQADYHGDGEAECPQCGNLLNGEFRATEYPAGCLEGDVEVTVSDSEETGASRISPPSIFFYDI